MPQKEPFAEYNNVVFLICNSMLFILARRNHMQAVIVYLISFSLLMWFVISVAFLWWIFKFKYWKSEINAKLIGNWNLMQVRKVRPFYYKKTNWNIGHKSLCFMSLKLTKAVFIWLKIQQSTYTTLFYFTYKMLLCCWIYLLRIENI